MKKRISVFVQTPPTVEVKSNGGQSGHTISPLQSNSNDHRTADCSRSRNAPNYATEFQNFSPLLLLFVVARARARHSVHVSQQRSLLSTPPPAGYKIRVGGRIFYRSAPTLN